MSDRDDRDDLQARAHRRETTLILINLALAAVVAAWGANSLAIDRARHICRILGRSLRCLGRTKSGAPRHPLYAPASIDRTHLEVWAP